MVQGNHQPTHLKEIGAAGSGIIATRTTDGRRTDFDYMSSADMVKQS